MRRLIILLLAILITACTIPPGEYSVSVNLPAPITWGQTPTPAKPTPLPTYTQTPTLTPANWLDPTIDVSPTQETGAVIPTDTPIVIPPTVYVTKFVMNVRTDHNLDNTFKQKLPAGSLVEIRWQDGYDIISDVGYEWGYVYEFTGQPGQGAALGWVAMRRGDTVYLEPWAG